MRVLIDLDDTLVDRTGAFRRWADGFVAENPDSGEAADAAWLVDADGDGCTPRAGLARSIIDRFGLTVSAESLVERLLFEHVRFVQPYPGVRTG